MDLFSEFLIHIHTQRSNRNTPTRSNKSLVKLNQKQPVAEGVSWISASLLGSKCARRFLTKQKRLWLQRIHGRNVDEKMMKHLGAWQEGKRCVKARGVFSGCRFQIADLMFFLTLTFSYFLWMISLNRYGVYGEISNNQAIWQSFWNWQALALQRPAQKLLEGTTRCWAQRSVGITTYIYLLLYWQVFGNDAETWFPIQLVIMAYASKWYILYILGILGPALTNNAIGHWMFLVAVWWHFLSCPVWDLLGMFGIFRNKWMSDSQ